MKLNMLKNKLQNSERTLLHKAKSRTDIPSERITIILSGMKATEIAQIVNLNPNTASYTPISSTLSICLIKSYIIHRHKTINAKAIS